MKEIIETLNHTSPARTVFYCLVFLVALFIVALVVIELINVFNRK